MMGLEVHLLLKAFQPGRFDASDMQPDSLKNEAMLTFL